MSLVMVGRAAATTACVVALKRALDPDSIIAPGRYD
jgi:hypothetical protein